MRYRLAFAVVIASGLFACADVARWCASILTRRTFVISSATTCARRCASWRITRGNLTVFCNTVTRPTSSEMIYPAASCGESIPQ